MISQCSTYGYIYNNYACDIVGYQLISCRATFSYILDTTSAGLLQGCPIVFNTREEGLKNAVWIAFLVILYQTCKYISYLSCTMQVQLLMHAGMPLATIMHCLGFKSPLGWDYF